MTLNQITGEWEHISWERKQMAMKELFDFLSLQKEDQDNIIYGMFNYFSVHEQDDYFGTEGADL